MSTGRVGSLPSKKKKKKEGRRGNVQEERKRKRKKKNEEEQRGFCPKMMSNFSPKFFLHFGERTFWWARRDNIWVPPFIFLPPHPTKHTPKSFHSHFLSKIFHLSYFTSKQTHPKSWHLELPRVSTNPLEENFNNNFIYPAKCTNTEFWPYIGFPSYTKERKYISS